MKSGMQVLIMAFWGLCGIQAHAMNVEPSQTELELIQYRKEQETKRKKAAPAKEVAQLKEEGAPVDVYGSKLKGLIGPKALHVVFEYLRNNTEYPLVYHKKSAHLITALCGYEDACGLNICTGLSNGEIRRNTYKFCDDVMGIPKPVLMGTETVYRSPAISEENSVPKGTNDRQAPSLTNSHPIISLCCTNSRDENAARVLVSKHGDGFIQVDNLDTKKSQRIPLNEPAVVRCVDHQAGNIVVHMATPPEEPMYRLWDIYINAKTGDVKREMIWADKYQPTQGARDIYTDTMGKTEIVFAYKVLNVMYLDFYRSKKLVFIPVDISPKAIITCVKYYCAAGKHSYIAVGTSEGDVIVIDLTLNKIIHLFEKPYDSVGSIELVGGADFVSVMVDYSSGFVCMCDVKSGKCAQLEHRKSSSGKHFSQSKKITINKKTTLITGGDSLDMYKILACSNFEQECFKQLISKQKEAEKKNANEKLFMTRKEAIKREQITTASCACSCACIIQ